MYPQAIAPARETLEAIGGLVPTDIVLQLMALVMEELVLELLMEAEIRKFGVSVIHWY
ncbi:MAG: hypothetical protein IEMM0008_1115 [bacterium]|nr:MAG: hypothetical protein IEMM0008_1115 [bacterium]